MAKADTPPRWQHSHRGSQMHGEDFDAWIERHDTELAERICRWVYNNQPRIGDSMREYTDRLLEYIRT